MTLMPVASSKAVIGQRLLLVHRAVDRERAFGFLAAARRSCEPIQDGSSGGRNCAPAVAAKAGTRKQPETAAGSAA